MTPPCYTFPAAELSERAQLDVHGRQRKMPLSPAPAPAPADTLSGEPVDASSTNRAPEKTNNRAHNIDLARDCALLSSMVQYSCAVLHPEMRDSPVRCWPVQRLFRRCQDRHGSFMVETTAWEGSESANRSSGGSGSSIATDTAPETNRKNDGSAAAAAPTVSRAGLTHRSDTLRVFG